MKQLKFSTAAMGFLLCIAAAACSNNRVGTDAASGDRKDTVLVDTRRNSGDTTNYLTKDSGNKSQEVVDPNPPQNSRY